MWYWPLNIFHTHDNSTQWFKRLSKKSISINTETKGNTCRIYLQSLNVKKLEAIITACQLCGAARPTSRRKSHWYEHGRDWLSVTGRKLFHCQRITLRVLRWHFTYLGATLTCLLQVSFLTWRRTSSETAHFLSIVLNWYDIENQCSTRKTRPPKQQTEKKSEIYKYQCTVSTKNE